MHKDYLVYANQRKAKVRHAQMQYEQKLFKRLHSAPKAFYGYVRSKKKVKDHIGPLENSSGSLTSDNQEMAEILSKFFQSTFTDENLESIPNTSECLPEISLTKQSILNKSVKLNATKAPCVLKNCAELLVNPLYYLFQQSLAK